MPLTRNDFAQAEQAAPAPAEPQPLGNIEFESPEGFRVTATVLDNRSVKLSAVGHTVTLETEVLEALANALGR